MLEYTKNTEANAHHTPLTPLKRGIPHHNPSLRTHNSELKKMSKKEIIQKIIHLLATILTAIATTLGTTSCIGLMQ